MIDLGTVKPGSTIRIPFSTFDKDDGSSVSMTDFAVGDILIYKDGSTTARGSTNGFTATTDFNSKTGKQLAVIDLADNTTAGFYSAGSEYLVAIDQVTVDGVTTGGWIARFRIGYPGAMLDTTISALGASSNQMVFNLTNGPPEDDALNGMLAVIHDAAHAYQCAYVVIQDYIGDSKTVILAALPVFGIAAGDNFSVTGPAPLQPTTEKMKSSARALDVSSGGEAGIDWANIGTPGSTQNLSATTTNVVNTATAVTTVNGLAANVITAASVADGAIDAATFAADVDAEILSYLVDDATRIDASALNTATGTSIPAILDDTGTSGVVVASINNNAITAAAIANGAIDAATFAADVDAEILSYLVDDATRIDASALNTATATSIPAILEDTGTTLQGEVDGIEADVDTLLTRLGTPSDLGSGATVAANLVDIEAQTDDIGVAGAGLTAINLPDQTMNITGNITGNLSGSVGSVSGAVGSVTGNVGGNVTGTIGGLTAAALKDFFDTDTTAVYGDAVAGSVVKEIADNAGGSALTEAGIASAVRTELTTELGRIDVAVSTRASQTSVNTVDDFLDTEIAAIKAVTDQITFTVSNVIDANVRAVNNITVDGSGTAGDPWGPV